MSIRDLRRKDIVLLREAYTNSLNVIKAKYGINSNHLKAYFHYRPSAWQLHLHIVHNNYHQVKSSVEYCHSIINVLYNLEINDLYYANATLQIEVY